MVSKFKNVFTLARICSNHAFSILILKTFQELHLMFFCIDSNLCLRPKSCTQNGSQMMMSSIGLWTQSCSDFMIGSCLSMVLPKHSISLFSTNIAILFKLVTQKNSARSWTNTDAASTSRPFYMITWARFVELLLQGQGCQLKKHACDWCMMFWSRKNIRGSPTKP